MSDHETQHENLKGLFLHVYQQTYRGRSAIHAIGKSDDGRTFGVLDTRVSPSLLVRSDLSESITELIKQNGGSIAPSPRTAVDGTPLQIVYCRTEKDLRGLRNELEQLLVTTYEADLSLIKDYLIDRQIRGPVQIKGKSQPGRHVDTVFINPDIEPTDASPVLTILSLDIETTMDHGQVTAVSLVLFDSTGTTRREEVHILTPREAGSNSLPDTITEHTSERALLITLDRRIRELDPDIITGWNVIDFDLRVLLQRFDSLGTPFRPARTDDPPFLQEGTSYGAERCIIQGRQVLDAMHLARRMLANLPDYRLETVATEVLGRGKLLAAADEDDAAAVIEEARQKDTMLFAEYCLEDARLVRDIVNEKQLLLTTLRRASLTGLAPDRAWGSITAFDFLYLSGLRRLGLAAPTNRDTESETRGAPGGLVLDPKPGLYSNVLVFDFKSLYPSIIRTFNIDPLSHVRGRTATDRATIQAPNGVRFSRQPGVLPGMLDEFFDERDKAKKREDALASYTYKIVMNSFYGVLGTSACRFGSADLAGAITSFGQSLLLWCRDYLNNQSLQVIYGDTDSLFVLPNLPEDVPPEKANQEGKQICAQVNAELGAYIRETYQVPSRLELEFEKHYTRFLMPPSRSNQDKGRAKGYAGLKSTQKGPVLEIVGMEAVRSDWTDMAHEFQRTLFSKIFRGDSAQDLELFVTRWITALRRGEYDDDLVYRRRLRKKVESYTRTTPPHVRAARISGQKSGTVRYVITSTGPEPADSPTHRLDYSHYIDKQIAPILGAVAPYCGIDTQAAITGEARLF